jgi:hypothetical protein
MSDVRRDRRLVPVPETIRETVATLVREKGPKYAAKTLGVSRGTTVEIALGLRVMPGSLALVERSLERVA